MEKGWCWRAADARHRGEPAPEDPRECLSPCPPTTRRCEEILELVRLAHRQARLSFSGVVGLDWNVLVRMADDAGIETTMEWYELLSAAEGEWVAAMTPKKEGEEG